MNFDRRTLLLAMAGSLLSSTAAWPEEPLRPFMLEDVNGKVVDDGALQGRASLVFFGYTSCPDICPTAMMTVSRVLQLLGPDGDKLLALFISLDPRRDTRKVLSDYAANFDPRIVPLRGPEPYVEAAAQAFGVTYRVVTPGTSKPDDYTIDHSALIFLVGPDGRIAQRFGHSEPAEKIAARVKEIMASIAGAQGN